LKDADWCEYATYLQSRPAEAEIEAIRLLIDTCRRHRLHVHVVHLATMQALDELEAARAEGLPITVETCPHYLYFAAEDVARSATLKKCAPPIRSRTNREGLWDGLRHGTIDLIATDHSPCPPEMKGLEVGDFAKEKLSQWMSAAPAQLAGLDRRKGIIAPGMDADFVVFDPETSFEVTKDNLVYRHPVSPYLSERLYGVVKHTILRGQEITPEGTPSGTEV